MTEIPVKEILDAMPVGYAHHKMIYYRNKDPRDYLFLEVNRQFCDLMNIEYGTVVDRRVSEVFTEFYEEVNSWIQHFDSAIKLKKQVAFDVFVPHLKKTLKVLAFSSKFPYFTTFFMDITHENASLNKESTTDDIFAALNLAYNHEADYFFDWETWERPTGDLIYVSQASERITGYPIQSFRDDPDFFKSIILPEDMIIWTEYLRIKSPDMGLKTIEFRITHKKGNALWIEHRCAPVFDDQGKHLGYRSHIQNITKRILEEQNTQLSEQRYKLLFDHAVEGIMVVQDDYIKICNPMLTEIMGYSSKQLMEVPFIQFVYFEDIADYTGKCKGSRVDQYEASKNEFRVIYRNGEIRWIEVKGISIEWEGKPASLRFVVDITQRKITEDALKRSEEKYRFLTENTSDVIWVYNLNRSEFEYISPSVLLLLGRSTREVYMHPLDTLLCDPTKTEYINKIITRSEAFTKNPDTDLCFMDEVQQIRSDGKVVWTEVSSKFRFNNSDEIELIGVSRNIEERKQQEEKVLYLSYYDQLTGLNNRRYYEEKLESYNQESYMPVSLIVADVNGLKLTNDAFGHVKGDQLLIEVSRTLEKALRKGDVLARIGGDEFVFILPNTDTLEAKLFIEGLRRLFEEKSLDEIVISVSFGFETKMELEQNFEEVFSRAEDFMYKRKLTESRSMKSTTFKKILLKLNKTYPESNKQSVMMSHLCKDFAKALNFSDAEIQDIGMLALVHDVGKVNFSSHMALNSDLLNKEELKEYRRHPEIGYQILRSTPEFAHLADFVLCHHEQFDGLGYPRHISGNLIPLQSRILAIVEMFVRLIHGTSTQKSMDSKDAISVIESEVGKKFDPELVQVFLKLMY